MWPWTLSPFILSLLLHLDHLYPTWGCRSPRSSEEELTPGM